MIENDQHQFNRVLGGICYLTTILYLIEQFYPSKWLIIIYSMLGLALLFCAFIYISKVNRMIVSLLLLSGSICFFIEQVPILQVISGFGENINLLSLFLLIPFIGTFMSVAGYLNALKEKVQASEQRAGRHPYSLSFALTSIISVLLNYGSIAIVKQISKESFIHYKDKQLTLNVMRAFGINMLLSPYFVNVGLVLVLFDLSWFDIGKYGWFLACIYLVISWLSFKSIEFSNDPIIINNESRSTAAIVPSILPVLLFGLVLMGSSLLLDLLLDVPMLTVVCLISIILPIIWTLITRITGLYLKEVTGQIQSAFMKLKNELSIFISAGFFGMGLSQTEVGTYIAHFLFNIAFGSSYLLSLLIVFMAIVLAQVGVHPVIIIIGIGSSLSPESFGVSPEYMALCLLIAWTASTQMSPFSGQVLLASRLMNQEPKVVVKQNATFSIMLAIVLTTSLYVVELLGWI